MSTVRTCAYGASAARMMGMGWRDSGGWRKVDGRHLCPECAADRYWQLGSSLRPPATPPAPSWPARPSCGLPAPGRPNSARSRLAPGGPEPRSAARRSRRFWPPPNAATPTLGESSAAHQNRVRLARRRLRERGDLPPMRPKPPPRWTGEAQRYAAPESGDQRNRAAPPKRRSSPTRTDRTPRSPTNSAAGSGR
jgi:hypothetical protein